MPKLRCLDLFCGQGGAGMGYSLAGFEVVGVDNRPQPRYPFEFHHADALEYVRLHGTEFDLIHASPPCQYYSVTFSLSSKKHVGLILETRQALIDARKPYVIENVAGAPLINPVMLCGTFFNLKVYRHRLFESNFFLLSPLHLPHHDKTPSTGRGKSPKGFISITGTGGCGFVGWQDYVKIAMGIDWMTKAGLSQAIPPAYTEWIGRQFLTQQVFNRLKSAA
jgi:DNA (cytosine-5)-methyltransferase 1